MLHSRTPEDRKISFFISLLRHLIEGNEEYAHFVNPVIADVRALSIGEKSYFTVDRDNYPIIVYLFDKDKEYFANLDLDNVTLGNYQDISSMLQQQRLFAIA